MDREAETTMTYHEAVKELYFWQHANLGNFHSQLYDLIAKADKENFMRLAQGFPEECRAWFNWKLSEDSGAFFKDNGFTP